MDDTPRRDMEATAYHEAGHAVAAFALGRAFTRVSIVANGHTLGRCSFRTPGEWFRPDLRMDAATRRRLEERIMISLAGPEAESRFTGVYDANAAQEDVDRALDHACFVATDALEASAYVEWLRIRTQNLMKTPGFWTGVESLAGELMERIEVSYRQARSLLHVVSARAGETPPGRGAAPGQFEAARHI